MSQRRARVALVGPGDQNNLGLGYLAAVLGRAGHVVDVIDSNRDDREVISELREIRPDLIGFSLIFQFHMSRLGAMVGRVRDAMPRVHLTVGGHFPSLRPQELLEHIPQLDSIVRFEGELTLLDLTDRVVAGQDWTTTPGIAYRSGREVVLAPLRELIPDLDSIPYPVRKRSTYSILGRSADTLIGSRGCARRCSFCSIHTFYRSSPGLAVRFREPRAVVEEMRHLHVDSGVEVFLFQDDNFPLSGRRGRSWVDQFLTSMRKAGLYGRVLFKINCRVDDVEDSLFESLRDAGLFLVYLGIESGTPAGLKLFHKQVTVDQVHRAAATLRALDLAFNYGYMLVHPATTLDSLRQDLRFLAELTAPGDVAVSFCRMIPYAGTPIREQLETQGRLTGDIENPSYALLSPQVERFHARLHSLAGPWLSDGLSQELNYAHTEVRVLRRLHLPIPEEEVDVYHDRLKELTRESNGSLLRTVTELIDEAEGAAGDSRVHQVSIRSAVSGMQSQVQAHREGFISQYADVILGGMEGG